MGLSACFSQFTSLVTSISKNEKNIRISLCNVQHLNGLMKISLEIFPKKTHFLTEKKKIQNAWETIFILEILNAVI